MFAIQFQISKILLFERQFCRSNKSHTRQRTSRAQQLISNCGTNAIRDHSRSSDTKYRNHRYAEPKRKIAD